MAASPIGTEITSLSDTEITMSKTKSDRSLEKTVSLNDMEITTFSKTEAASEPKADDEGTGEESELAMEDTMTSIDKDKEGDLPVESSTAKKAKGKKKRKKTKLPKDDKTSSEGKGKEGPMLVEGSTNGEGNSKDQGLPPKDDIAGEVRYINDGTMWTYIGSRVRNRLESSLLMEGPVTGKGKGNENDLPLADTTVSKGKSKQYNHGGDSDLVSNDIDKEAPMRKLHSDLLSDAKGLFLDPKSGGFMSLNLSAALKSVASRSPPNLQCAPRNLLTSPLTPEEEDVLIGYQGLFDMMKELIRPQTATPEQVDILCRTLVVYPNTFIALQPLIDELRWNCEIVEHPSNPMITRILQCTAHLRPTNGVRHPAGVSGAPLVPQYPPLPPGPAPATPTVIIPTQQQYSNRHARKISLEEKAKSLELREAAIVVKMGAEIPADDAKALGELMEIRNTRNALKEKARLERVGGAVADMLARRQKMRAEQGEASAWQPPS